MSYVADPHELRRTAALLDDAQALLVSAGDRLSRVAVPPDPHDDKGPDIGSALVRFAHTYADETFALKIAAEQLATGLRTSAAAYEETDREAARAYRDAATPAGRR
jgi:hypothetical protein